MIEKVEDELPFRAEDIAVLYANTQFDLEAMTQQINQFAKNYHALQCKNCPTNGLRPYLDVNELYKD
jgi:hypothetical protein